MKRKMIHGATGTTYFCLLLIIADLRQYVEEIKHEIEKEDDS